MLVGWAALVAVEEGTVSLDQPVGQEGCTLRHLLAHAGGYSFDGPAPIAKPGTRRIYSNTGIELAADAIGEAAGMPFELYLREAVFEPLGMHSTALKGSPAYAVWSTVTDLVAFVHEVRAPHLVAAESALAFRTPQFPTLAGLVPGVGRFDPCPWGLGAEIKGAKNPHWTGTRNSPATFGHFGGAGTLLSVDPGAHIAMVALTDRAFDEWAADALVLWREFADAVLLEAAAAPTGGATT
jgi:CubicO group peptidase (beta-lactamase class C family)